MLILLVDVERMVESHDLQVLRRSRYTLLTWGWLNSTTCSELVTQPIEYETKSNNTKSGVLEVVDQPSQPVVEVIVPVVIAAKNDVMTPLFIIVVQHDFCSIAEA